MHKKQKEFQESKEFKELSKERYKIEAKNSELKNAHGYGRSVGNGLYETKIQGACVIFVTNEKKVLGFSVGSKKMQCDTPYGQKADTQDHFHGSDFVI